MKRILVAYDATPGAEAALMNLACAGLPDRAEAKVFSLADVWLPPDLERETIFPDRVAGSRINAREHALSAMTEARKASTKGTEKLKALFPRWQIQASAKADSPAWGILAEARRWAADLVVLGSHGRSPLQKFFLGSVSYKVAAEAACSVRIFKPTHHKTDSQLRLVLAVDGSTDSKLAVADVLDRDWPQETEFHLISVVDPKARTAPRWDDDLAITEDWIPSMLAEEGEKFQARQLNVSTHVLEGDVKNAVLENAEKWRADCIFLGARGVDHRDRLYLGTTASAVVTRAHCTVEIVRTRINAMQGVPADAASESKNLQPV